MADKDKYMVSEHDDGSDKVMVTSVCKDKKIISVHEDSDNERITPSCNGESDDNITSIHKSKMSSVPIKEEKNSTIDSNIDGNIIKLSSHEDISKTPLSDIGNDNELNIDDASNNSPSYAFNDTGNQHKALIHEEMLLSDDDDSCLESNKDDESTNQSNLQEDNKIKLESTDDKSISNSIEEKTHKNENSMILIKVEQGSPKKKLPTKLKHNKLEKKLITSITDNVDVPEGWKRTAVQRQGGLSAGKFDVYYFSPLGKKLRSKNEVVSYCQNNGIKIDIDQFRFTQFNTSRRKISSMPKVPKTMNDEISRKRKISDIDQTPVTGASPKRNKLSLSSNKRIDSSSNKEAKKSAKTSEKERKRLHFKETSKYSKSRSRKSIWMPPKSPFNLYQESLFHEPWQMLVGTIFLSKTSGDDDLGRNVLWEFIEKWPTPEMFLEGDRNEIIDVIKPLGIHDKRIKLLSQFSDDYINKSWHYPKELHGIGKYGNDCYRIFCINEWDKVKPTDYLLTFYTDWLWDNHKFLGLG